MATRQGSGGFTEGRRWSYTWAGITEADEGNPIKIPAYVEEFTFQVVGTFGGGTFQLQGSNDGVNYIVLQDWANADVGATTTKVFRVSNLPNFVKPKATAGAAANVSAALHGTAE